MARTGTQTIAPMGRDPRSTESRIVALAVEPCFVEVRVSSQAEGGQDPGLWLEWMALVTTSESGPAHSVMNN